MDQHLVHYVTRHYSNFMNDAERRAYSHLGAALKATHGRSDVPAQEVARQHKIFSRWVSDDPKVLELAKDGYHSFAERTAERILAEHEGAILLNLCPRCQTLARTPTARQCRFCGHDWHNA
jgi:hypothetical protein